MTREQRKAEHAPMHAIVASGHGLVCPRGVRFRAPGARTGPVANGQVKKFIRELVAVFD
jgi:hypothetical protein